MLHILFLINLGSFLLVQSLYSMEKKATNEHKHHKLSLIQKRKKSLDTPPTKNTPPIAIPHQMPTESMSISITPSSASTSADSSQLYSSKVKKYSRSKTVDGTSTKSKENHIKLFSSSDGSSNFSLLKKSPRQKINILTTAVQNYDLDTVEEYINNPDANLNQKDGWDNTALHRAVIKLTEPINNEDLLKKIITLFLHDPRTDSSIARDKDNRTASQILSGGELPEMRNLLFARVTLDIQTNHEIGKMLLENCINNIPVNENCIKQTVQCIKYKIHATEDAQKGNKKDLRDLPKEATLPDYATDDFICDMIKKRIPLTLESISEQQKERIQKVFFEEIQAILLNVSVNINEKSVQESIDTIVDVLHSNQLHDVIKFTTKPCIFELIKMYTDKQKTQNKTDVLFAKMNG